MAFNAEVIIALGGEPALPVSTFQNALGQRDRGRNARSLHFFRSPLGVGGDVGLSRGKGSLGAGGAPFGRQTEFAPKSSIELRRKANVLMG